MVKEIVIKSEDGKRGFIIMPDIVDESSIARKTEIIIEISFKQFFAGLKQYVLSPEQLYLSVGVSDNLQISDLYYHEMEPGIYEIEGEIKKRKLKKGEEDNSVTVPFIYVYESQQNRITVELIQWYNITQKEVRMDVFSDFTNFLGYAIYSKWSETKRQLHQFFDYPDNDCDEEVFSYVVKTTTENFHLDCLGESSLFVKSYQYFIGEKKLPINTSIEYILLPPDYINKNTELLFIAHDSIPYGKTEGYEEVLIRGERNVVAKLLISPRAYSRCVVKLMKNTELPFHDEFIQSLHKWIQATYVNAENPQPRIRQGGKRPDTIVKEECIKQLLKDHPNEKQLKIAYMASEILGRSVSDKAVSRVAVAIRKEKENSR